MELLVVDIVREADCVVSIVLEHPGGHPVPAWSPGDHVDIRIPDVGLRSYSLCGDPRDEKRYRIGVKLLTVSRGGSQFMHRLSRGDLVEVGNPIGAFPLVLDRVRYVFVAGGIGITPILPMIRTVTDAGLPFKLYYLGSRRSDMPFLDEIVRLAPEAIIWAQEERRSRIPLARIVAAALPDGALYCCGPDALMTELRDLTEKEPLVAFRMERFSASPKSSPVACVDDGPTFDVICARSGVRASVQPGETILEVLEKAGVPVASSCREGFCGTCKTVVLSGRPDHRDDILVPAERRVGDCMYICVSRSLTSELELDI